VVEPIEWVFWGAAAIHAVLDIYFVKWALWRNEKLTMLLVAHHQGLEVSEEDE